MSSWLRYMHGELVNDDGDCGISGDCESGQESSRPRSNDGANTLISGSILVLRLRTYVHLIRSNFLIPQNVHFHNFHYFFHMKIQLFRRKWNHWENDIFMKCITGNYHLLFSMWKFTISSLIIFIDNFELSLLYKHYSSKIFSNKFISEKNLSTKAAFNQTNFEEMQIFQKFMRKLSKMCPKQWKHISNPLRKLVARTY